MWEAATDDGVTASGVDQFADEVGHGCREHDRFAAQSDSGVVVAMPHPNPEISEIPDR
jgi:hypothetical protein